YDGYMVVPGMGGRHPEPVEYRVVMEYGGGVETVVGPASIAVPGAWDAFGLAHAAHGTVPWREVLAPSIDLARDGVPLGATAELYLDHARDPVFSLDRTGSEALHRDGRPVRIGDPVRVDGLAATLERIPAVGAGDVYRGEIGS